MLSSYEDFNYANLAGVTINASNTNDTFRVNSSPASTSFALVGNDGNDTFTMLDDPNSIATFTCNGGNGTDSFTLDSSASSDGSTYTILPGQMSRVHGGASGAYSFNGVELTTLNATQGDDTINFTGYFATPLTINALGGNDTVGFIGDNAPALQPFATIDGGSGTDSFTMNDQTTAGGIKVTRCRVGRLSVPTTPTVSRTHQYPRI